MATDVMDTIYGPMPIQFKKSLLKNLCVEGEGVQTGPFGSQLHANDYAEKGTPIIAVEHLGENRIIHKNLPYVTDEDKKRLARYTLSVGDIVFSRVGSVDRRAIVRQEEEGWLFSGRCLRIRPDPQKIFPHYLSWFFGLPRFQEHIRQIAVGATMPSLNTQILSNIPIYYPSSWKEQKAIACILGALDDKIELNRQMSRTLEEIARTIFKSWFVNFDLVHAKAAGQRPIGLSPDIADLFPDGFEDSELGKIPKGWTVGNSCDLIDFDPPVFLRRGTEAVYVDMKAVPTSGSSVSEWERRAYSGGSRFQQNDTLLARITPCLENGKSALVDFLEDGAPAFGSTEFIVMRPKPGVPRVWPYCLVRYEPFRMHAITNMTGSSGRQRVSRESLMNYKLPLPSGELLKRFGTITESFFQQISHNVNESRILAKIRDTLLPELISGGFRISEAERIVERCAG